jgi:uncharacterized protein YjbI with pentapeptide repeats
LIDEAARAMRQRNGMVEVLEAVLESSEQERIHPVTASVLLALEPSWRPAPRYLPNLTGARLCKAQWQHVDLFRARLGMCDLSSADLRQARLQQAKAVRTKLSRADLRAAILQEIDAENADLAAQLCEVEARRANFAHANLQEALLDRSRFLASLSELVSPPLLEGRFARRSSATPNWKRRFSNADLSRAVFANPKLNETRLASARLHKTWPLVATWRRWIYAEWI